MQTELEKSESGAALIALLALMAIMALLMIGAAPMVYQQVQREREIESIQRGDEIAEAIKQFAFYQKRLPKNMKELLEGVQVPGRTKKLMILRKSAATDPLTESGEWRLVQSNDKILVNFYRKVITYNNGRTPDTPQIPALQAPFGQIVSLIDTDTDEDTDPPGGENTDQNTDAPFIGVVSRAQTKAVIGFYGIQRHDWWIYTPLFRGGGSGSDNGANLNQQNRSTNQSSFGTSSNSTMMTNSNR